MSTQVKKVEVPSPIREGHTLNVARGTTLATGTHVFSAVVHCDAALVSAWVSSVSGTVDIEILTGVDYEYDFTQLKLVSVAVFPQVTASTSELLLKKAGITMNRLFLKVVVVGSCSLDLDVKGLTAGETNAVISGASAAKASKVTAITTVSQIIPPSALDRTGLIIKNLKTNTGTLYLGFTSAEASFGTGYPIEPGETIALDVAGGQGIFGVSSSGILDLRIMEGGN